MNHGTWNTAPICQEVSQEGCPRPIHCRHRRRPVLQTFEPAFGQTTPHLRLEGRTDLPPGSGNLGKLGFRP